MRYFNIIMWVIRGLAILIIIFCGYSFLTDRFNLRELAPIIIAFLIIYFLGSMFQLYMRSRRAGRYPKESNVEEEEEEKKND